MIKKFEEYIQEGLWSKGIERSKSGNIRKEQGEKVMTSLGVEILIQDRTFDYEEIIKNICDGTRYDDFGISYSNLRDFSFDEQKNILNDKSIYTHMIGHNLVAMFPTYDELVDGECMDGTMISEEGYISIIKAISTCLKMCEVDYIENYRGNDEYGFCLIDNTLQYVIDKSDDEDVLNMYSQNLCNQFKEMFEKKFRWKSSLTIMENEDGGHIIYLPICYSSLKIIGEVVEFTQEFIGSI